MEHYIEINDSRIIYYQRQQNQWEIVFLLIKVSECPYNCINFLF